jgi:hypothetical protein
MRRNITFLVIFLCFSILVLCLCYVTHLCAGHRSWNLAGPCHRKLGSSLTVMESWILEHHAVMYYDMTNLKKFYVHGLLRIKPTF